jgi:hypothetical protein
MFWWTFRSTFVLFRALFDLILLRIALGFCREAVARSGRVAVKLCQAVKSYPVSSSCRVPVEFPVELSRPGLKPPGGREVAGATSDWVG